MSNTLFISNNKSPTSFDGRNPYRRPPIEKINIIKILLIKEIKIEIREIMIIGIIILKRRIKLKLCN